MKIEIKNLTKSFGDVKALENISLTIEENKIYGLLGRNGAGKSTLLNLITNQLFADSGEILLNGEKLSEADHLLKNIFLMSEKNFYPKGMKIKDVFRWTKEFYPSFDTDYAENLAKRFGLIINKKVKELSTGYSSIFKVIIALAVNIPFILLDEPILGLDANHRDLFYKILMENYIEKPKTIIISTHLIEEVSNVIEQVIIIKNGRIIKDLPTEELIASGYTISGTARLIDEFIKDKNVISLTQIGGLKTANIIGKLANKEIPHGLEVAKLDLQKLFIELTNSEVA